jgi:hypothetical protein
MSKIYTAKLFGSTLALSALLSLVPAQAHDGNNCCGHKATESGVSLELNGVETQEGTETATTEDENQPGLPKETAQAWHQRRSARLAATAAVVVIAYAGFEAYRFTASKRAFAQAFAANLAKEDAEKTATAAQLLAAQIAEQAARTAQAAQAAQAAYFGVPHNASKFVAAVTESPLAKQFTAACTSACVKAGNLDAHELNAQVAPELSDYLPASPSRSYHCPYMARRRQIASDVMSTCPPVKYVSGLATEVSKNASELAAQASKSASELATKVGEKIKEFRS